MAQIRSGASGLSALCRHRRRARIQWIPKIGTDPAACGWKQIASVDTRPQGPPSGGRYTVHITDLSGSLGNYRYLIFEPYVTETADLWGHTFYGEVEVIRRR